MPRPELDVPDHQERRRPAAGIGRRPRQHLRDRDDHHGAVLDQVPARFLPREGGERELTEGTVRGDENEPRPAQVLLERGPDEPADLGPGVAAVPVGPAVHPAPGGDRPLDGREFAQVDADDRPPPPGDEGE